MKKFLIIATMISCLFIFGCNKHSGSDEGFFYDDVLTVEGVFESMENHTMSEEGVLVLDGHFEYHADHIYFPKGMWEEYFESENEYLPGNNVKFMGNIKQIDAGAGNHYYEVVSVYKMKIKGYPEKEEIESIVDSYNFCETESDCVDFDPGCAFDCSMSVNLSYEDIASKIVNNYNTLNNQSCKRDCSNTIQMACKNNKCVALTQKPMIPCTEEDRAIVECPSEFDPVCGSDGAGYNNSCLACQLKYIDSYSIGGCDGISYIVKGTPKSLEYVVGFLESNGSMTCDMTYSFKGENLKGKIFADNDRFFAIRDTYFDGKIYHDYSLLSIGGKRYEWIREFPEISGVYQYAFKIPGEIEGQLVVAEVFDNFNIECHAGIDDESVFEIPNDVDFHLE